MTEPTTTDTEQQDHAAGLASINERKTDKTLRMIADYTSSIMKYEDAIAQFDRARLKAIATADAAGVPHNRIAAACGKTRSGMYRIIERARAEHADLYTAGS